MHFVKRKAPPRGRISAGRTDRSRLSMILLRVTGVRDGPVHLASKGGARFEHMPRLRGTFARGSAARSGGPRRIGR